MPRRRLTETEITIILEGDTSDEDQSFTDDEMEYDDILQRIQHQIDTFDEEDELRDELDLAGE